MKTIKKNIKHFNIPIYSDHYGCRDCSNISNGLYCSNCHDCSNIFACENCFGRRNAKVLKYAICNIEVGQEAYEANIKEFGI